MDDELRHGTFDLFHRFFSTEDACHSWYELSCFNRFEESDGDDMLSWKDKGYATIFDLLQVKGMKKKLIQDSFVNKNTWILFSPCCRINYPVIRDQLLT